MNRIWGSSRPSGSMPLATTDPDAAPAHGATSHSPNTPPLTRILSRRARWMVTITIFGLLLLVTFQNYDRLPGLKVSTPPDEHGLGSDPDVDRSSPNPQGDVDWSRFAYSQYVTNSDYLCNSVMLFDTLHQLGSRADRVMMYPSNFMDPSAAVGETHEARLIIKARDEYNVKLHPLSVQHRNVHDSTWADSYTKLHAFNLTQYDRVLSLDSDAIVLQHMDELFLLPPVPVAMPRAYWLWSDSKTLSSQLILLEPSHVEFERIQDKVSTAASTDYDMEVLNQVYGDSAMILPHRPYNMLTGEYRRVDHSMYLGSDREEWDPVAAYNEAKFLHFSDWPVPKPWLPTPDRLRLDYQPKCEVKEGREDCTSRDLWNGFYSDFRNHRARICGTGNTRRVKARRFKGPTSRRDELHPNIARSHGDSKEPTSEIGQSLLNTADIT